MTRQMILLGCMGSMTVVALCQQNQVNSDSIAVPRFGASLLAVAYDAKGGIQKDEEPKKPGDNTQPPAERSIDILHQSTLLGGWNGMREGLSEKGFDVSVLYKSDNFSNVSGGLAQDGAYIHNIDAVFSLDAEKLAGWTGGSALIHFISNNGGRLNACVGDAQMVSNIEAPKLTKLYQLWVQQNFSVGSLSILAGLYDLNSEFYVTTTSGLFLNGSHGIGKDLSQAGQNGPSVFPNTALATRIKVEPMPNLYAQAVVLDGVPGDPDDPFATSFHIDSREGALLVAEVGYSKEGSESDASHGKLALGVWRYTSSFSELLPNDAGEGVESSGNSGIYLLAETKVLCEGPSSSRGLALFARAGTANSGINKFNYHVGFGAVYTGLFPGREEDMLGLAVAHAHCGAEFKKLVLDAGSIVRNGELTVEITYRAQLTPWLAIQPNIQQIIQPGADAAIRDATVIGTRIEIKF